MQTNNEKKLSSRDNVHRKVEFHQRSDGRCCCTTSSFVTNNKKSTQEENDDPILSSMLAERLNELSVEEREHIFDEIHGISNGVEEDENIVADSLDSLEEEIQKISGPNGSAYDRAVNTDPDYVQNRAFRLMFLRGEEFDVEKAALKIINHFTYKLELFGEQKLVKDITYDDLSIEDRASLHTGSVQFLGESDLIRDVKGRAIVFHFPGSVGDRHWTHNCRARWYQVMTELKDESTQRNGFVVVNYLDGSTRIMGSKYKFKTNKVNSQALPARAAGIHFCFINHKVSPLLYPLIKSIVDLVGGKFLVKIRIHLEESPTSCIYTLQSFGIHSSTIPLGSDGRPRTDMFFKRLEYYKMLERKRPEMTVNCTNTSISNDRNTLSCDTLIPTRRDVLLGRGLKHPGNFALDKIIDHSVDMFKKATTQFEKTCTVISTVERVHASGARFLKLDNSSGCWVIADDNEVRTSVSSRLRVKSRKLQR